MHKSVHGDSRNPNCRACILQKNKQPERLFGLLDETFLTVQIAARCRRVGSIPVHAEHERDLARLRRVARIERQHAGLEEHFRASPRQATRRRRRSNRSGASNRRYPRRSMRRQPRSGNQPTHRCALEDSCTSCACSRRSRTARSGVSHRTCACRNGSCSFASALKLRMSGSAWNPLEERVLTGLRPVHVAAKYRAFASRPANRAAACAGRTGTVRIEHCAVWRADARRETEVEPVGETHRLQAAARAARCREP